MAKASYAILCGQLFVLDRIVKHVDGNSPTVVLCHPTNKDGIALKQDVEQHSLCPTPIVNDIRYVSQSDWIVGECEYIHRQQLISTVRTEYTTIINEEHGSFLAEDDVHTFSTVTAHSTPAQKIQLFRSLFRGRDDVYAHGFINRKTGKIGYAPTAWNEWTILSNGKRIPTPPNQRRCKPLTDQILLDHFTKRDERMTNVVGLYPMSKESKVWFLAIDFDDTDWKDAITATKQVCERYELTPAVERSRSGDGGHLWLFFTEQVESKSGKTHGRCVAH